MLKYPNKGHVVKRQENSKIGFVPNLPACIEEDIFADKAITWLTIITFLNLAHLRDVVGTLIAEYIHRLHAV